MLPAQGVELLRTARRRRRAARSNPTAVARGEAGLGSVAAQARRVAGALALLVALGVVAGCFGTPAGVDCERHRACGPESCNECLEIPGCGSLHIDQGRACAESCPLPFECSLSSTCPPSIRCDGLVPGQRRLAENEPRESSGY